MKLPVALAITGLLTSCDVHTIRYTAHAVHFEGFDEQAERTDRIPLALTEGQLLALTTRAGKIEIRTTDERPMLEAKLTMRGRTQQEAELALANYQIAVSTTNDGVSATIEGESLATKTDQGEVTIVPSVHLIASVPRGARVDARSSSGSIDAKGPLGATSLRSSYGALTLENVRGDVRAKTSSGAIAMRDIIGDHVHVYTSYGRIEMVRIHSAKIEAETSSGQVDLTRLEGSVTAKSSYGSVRISGKLQAVRAKTSSGAITVYNSSDSVDSVDLDSSYGGISVELPANIGGTLDAKTSYGRISSDFQVLVEAGETKRKHLRGTIGKGGTRIRLRTSSGNIDVRRRR